MFQAVDDTCHFLNITMWEEAPGYPPLAAMLAVNASTMFMAGVRTAMTGHAAAIFPTLRAALENACYAYLVDDDDALTDLWLNRHKDGASKKKSRAAFDGAVKTVKAKLNAIQAESGDFILEAYDAGIDHGGHPNPKGVLPHVSFPEAIAEGQPVNVTTLYGADQHFTRAALVACLDFGLAIALVLLRSLPTITKAQQEAFERLAENKEIVVEALNDDHHG